MTSPFEWAFFAITVLICWVPALMFVVGDIRGILARRRQAREEQQAGETYSAVRTHLKIVPAATGRTCAGCGTPLPPQSGRGRPRKWCSDKCRRHHWYVNNEKASARS